MSDLDPKQAHVESQWAHDRPLICCRFDPRGRYVFCGAEDATVQRFDVANGNRTALVGGHETWVRAIAFSQDGAFTISGGCEGRLTWWDTASESPKPVRGVPGHEGWIRSMSASPDGRLIASGGNDLMVRLWNADDGNLVREFSGHERHVYCVQFHPSGEYLLSGDLMGTLNQWNVATGELVRTFDAKPLHSYNDGQRVDFGGVRALAVSPDGRYLAAGGLYKASNPLGAVHEPLVLLFDWESQKVERQQIAEGITQGVIWRLQYLSDGTLMGVCGGGNGGFLIFWRSDSDKDVHRFQLPNIARDMDLHPDGVRVCSAHYDRHVRITRLAAKLDATSG